MATDAPKDTTKKINFEELKAHNTSSDLYVLIHGKVYDASKFLDEHPGGDEVILAEAGKDATEAFEDVGHSEEARKILDGLYVCEFDGAPANNGGNDRNGNGGGGATPGVPSGPTNKNPIAYLIPVACIGAFLAWRFYLAP